MRPCSQRRTDRRGFTLAEAIVCTLLVGTVLVGALELIGQTTRNRCVLGEQCLGPELAQQLMTEVLQARYQDPDGAPVFGPEPDESAATRAAFDDVDDYHRWSESPANPVQDKLGNPLPEYAQWRREVLVERVDPADPALLSASDLGLKRITVTVTDPQGGQTQLVALRAKYGVCEQRPDADTTYVTWAGINLSAGASAAPIRAGTNLINQPVQ